MINFFKYYNSAGLDNEHMRDVIRDAVSLIYNDDQSELLYPILHIIKKDCFLAYKYARDVVGGRWLEAEPTIMTSAGHTYWYAKDVMGFRWIEAEEYLKSIPNGYFWSEYQRAFGITSGV